MNAGNAKDPGDAAHAHDETGGRPRPWPLISSERGPDLLVARARFDTLTNPRTGRDLVRTVLETRDWVNVVALTTAGALVVVRQVRFGTGRVTTEIPGGVVDRGEEHGAAARRELREETGYTSERWSYLGSVEPNPAFLTNTCYHWLAEGVELTDATQFDAGEDIVTALYSPAELRGALERGEIRHGLVWNALSRVMDLSGLPPAPPA